MSHPLWQPEPEAVRATHLDRFRRDVSKRHGDFPDYPSLWQWSVDHPEVFWTELWDFAEIVGERGSTAVRDVEKMPGAQWFPEARLNFAENLLKPRDAFADRPAIIFRGEHGVRIEWTWAKLYDETSRWRKAFESQGLQAGDRVAALMPNLPEAVSVMLAASSMGLVFTSCSPDFGARGVLDRFGQVEPRLLISVDAYFYGDKRHPMLPKLGEILSELPTVETTIIAPYGQPAGEAPSSSDPSALAGVRDAIWQSDFLADHSPGQIDFKALPFDHPLYVLYSSGTTGPPKCIVHSAGGTLLQHRKEHLLHTNVQPNEGFFYFTTLGWMMWNWLVSGLASGATLHLYDGSPFHPEKNVLFDYLSEEGTSIFGTSAKFLEAARKAGLEPARSHDLSNVRTILSTGSPLAPESFDWVYEKLQPRAHLASISGGTDIVSCFLLGDPTAPVYRGELQVPGLGMAVDVFDDQGQPSPSETGELVCTRSFPSMPIGFWNDPDGARYHKAYFNRFSNIWCHGDFVARSEHGGFVVEGRSDSVLNPGGVRIGTAEIYRQVESLDAIEEAIAVGQEWQEDVRVILFVKLREGIALDDTLRDTIRTRLRQHASPRHVPAHILAVDDIPRTRSGKIVELAVREMLHGRPIKNREALANPEALEFFRDREELLR